jgi:hypothetical protein
MSTIKVDTLNEKSTNGNIAIIPTGSGKLVLDGLTWPHADGSASQLLKSNGSGVLSFVDAPSSGYTNQTVQATTSGTSKEFTSIPAGTTHIMLLMDQISAQSGNAFEVEIGDSGGYEVSGYLGCSFNNRGSVRAEHIITDAFALGLFQTTTQNIGGIAHFALMDASAFQWQMSGTMTGLGHDADFIFAGTKSLSAELDRIKFTSAGTLDEGSIGIAYL